MATSPKCFPSHFPLYWPLCLPNLIPTSLLHPAFLTHSQPSTHGLPSRPFYIPLPFPRTLFPRYWAGSFLSNFRSWLKSPCQSSQTGCLPWFHIPLPAAHPCRPSGLQLIVFSCLLYWQMPQRATAVFLHTAKALGSRIMPGNYRGSKHIIFTAW